MLCSNTHWKKSAALNKKIETRKKLWNVWKRNHAICLWYCVTDTCTLYKHAYSTHIHTQKRGMQMKENFFYLKYSQFFSPLFRFHFAFYHFFSALCVVSAYFERTINAQNEIWRDFIYSFVLSFVLFRVLLLLPLTSL